MPIYEYRNRHTGRVIEVIHKHGNIPKLLGFEDWERIPSRTSFVLKGEFSGGSTKHVYHEETATPAELKKHAESQRASEDARQEKQLDKHLEASLAEYDL